MSWACPQVLFSSHICGVFIVWCLYSLWVMCMRTSCPMRTLFQSQNTLMSLKFWPGWRSAYRCYHAAVSTDCYWLEGIRACHMSPYMSHVTIFSDHVVVAQHCCALCPEMWLCCDCQLVHYMPVSEFWNETALVHNSDNHMHCMKTAFEYRIINPLAPELST
jgi:hypothetical protein